MKKREVRAPATSGYSAPGAGILPASFYAGQYPGVMQWLSELNERGYMLGSELVEGDYLGGVTDAGDVAEKALLALEAEGLIRRGECRSSHTQNALASLGNMATVTKGAEPPTWFAWHPESELEASCLAGSTDYVRHSTSLVRSLICQDCTCERVLFWGMINS